eukprot:COSAG03_NODE_16_length_21807_cov_27.080247_1_plen_89_part_10
MKQTLITLCCCEGLACFRTTTKDRKQHAENCYRRALKVSLSLSLCLSLSLSVARSLARSLSRSLSLFVSLAFSLSVSVFAPPWSDSLCV